MSQKARFTSGSTMRHVAVMTATGATGLMALFLVDAANLLYISMLGVTEMAAAIGYAGTVQFFMVSVSIGLSIAATALVSRAIGAGDRTRARRLAASSILILVSVLSVAAALLWVFRDDALGAIGATGEAREIASGFLAIVVPSMPLLGIGMVASGFLRAAGDARRAMYVTLVGGIFAAALDPLFIFALDMGVQGAAVVSVLARACIAGVGLWGAVRIHDLIGKLDLRAAIGDARALMAIAAPAVATQLSTPFGNAYLTGIVSVHGDEAVAGWAVVGRVTALCFGGIFALSGAVGPIFGQNYGAGLDARIRSTYRDALIFAGIYVLIVWGVLTLALPFIVSGFGLIGQGAEVVESFAHIGAGAFLFTAALFVSNSAFNVLGRPHYSTVLNWSRDAGAIPLLAMLIPIGAHAEAVILVQASAALMVGSVAVLWGRRFVAQLRAPSEQADDAAEGGVEIPAFASGRGIGATVPGLRDGLAKPGETR